ncbi:hypothetical protein OPT61_g4717 [Boeremia exigua]|uniref:Uncharacterized protein n=1 Tax=Boeremia exigua TaxID=749465 RepID=A0ACC2ID27_9PLEO|nr:hypothetical protein OPT61_g4717 [Boeremia exigua]
MGPLRLALSTESILSVAAQDSTNASLAQVAGNALHLHLQGGLPLPGAFPRGSAAAVRCCDRSRLPLVSCRPPVQAQHPAARNKPAIQATPVPGEGAIPLREATPTAGMRALARSVSGSSDALRSRLGLCFWKSARNWPVAASQVLLAALLSRQSAAKLFQFIKHNV